MYSFLLDMYVGKNGVKMLMNFVIFKSVIYDSKRKTMVILFWVMWQNLLVGF